MAFGRQHFLEILGRVAAGQEVAVFVELGAWMAHPRYEAAMVAPKVIREAVPRRRPRALQEALLPVRT